MQATDHIAGQQDDGIAWNCMFMVILYENIVNLVLALRWFLVGKTCSLVKPSWHVI